ncbi:hypothetical protein ACI65C_006789 [Semiaphis heraclei]
MKTSGNNSIKWQYFHLMQQALEPTGKKQMMSLLKIQQHTSVSSPTSGYSGDFVSPSIVQQHTYLSTPTSQHCESPKNTKTHWMKDIIAFKQEQNDALTKRLDKLEEREGEMLRVQQQFVVKLEEANDIGKQKLELFRTMFSAPSLDSAREFSSKSNSEAFYNGMAPHISKTNRPVKVPLDIQLLGFIWIMATPDCYRSVAERFRMNRGTLHKIYRPIVSRVVSEAPRYIQWTTNEKKDEIKDEFFVASGYPGIVGAIDGCYIQIKQPCGDKRYRYVNRKKDYAVIIQGVWHIIKSYWTSNVHIGKVGSMHDARVFRRSELSNSLPRLLSPDEHIVGDSAYLISPHMMVPYKDNGVLTEKQKSHNNKLSKGRVKIENTWAQLKGKWRRLKYLDMDRIDYVVDHICGSCVLHNVALDGSDDEYGVEENEGIDVFEERDVDFERMKRVGQVKKDMLADIITKKK